MVQALYAKNADETEFIKVFNGKQVHWEGQISDSQVNEDQIDLGITMPDKRVILSNGKVVHLDSIVVTVPKNSVIPSNKRVRFRVTLQKEAPKIKGFEFPPSAVHLFTNTDSTTGISVTGIMIETETDGTIE